MKTGLLESRSRRLSVAFAVGAALLLAFALYYTTTSGDGAVPKVDAKKILAAAHAYSDYLRAHQMALPPSVPCQTLIDKKFLSAQDAGSFYGADAEIFLISPVNLYPPMVMRVHLADGYDAVLFGDGTISQVKR